MTKKRSSKNLLVILLCFTLVSISGQSIVLYQKRLSPSRDTGTCLLLPSFTRDDVIIHHSYYSLCYNERHKQASWVSYRLSGDMFQTRGVKRTGRFKPDPLLGGASAHPSDYKQSGFDRGHLCPAGDMRWSKQAMEETFYMSNVSPQHPGFNRGVWNSLEQKTRSWAIEHSELFITAGGILTEGQACIGENNVSVPGFFYKALVNIHSAEPKAIAFLIANKPSLQPIYDFVLPVDSLERLICIDLFAALPDTLENRIEAEVSIEKWEKNK